MNKKLNGQIGRYIIQGLCFLLLFMITFGLAIYGINNQKKPELIFNDIAYEKVTDSHFQSKSNHSIYVNFDWIDDKKVITITIENDDALITFPDGTGDYVIEKSGIIVKGSRNNETSDEYPELNKYFGLAHSYILFDSYMDEFPEIIVFPFLALFPFIIGVILLTFLFRKINKSKIKIGDQVIITVISIIFLVTTVLYIKIIFMYL